MKMALRCFGLTMAVLGLMGMVAGQARAGLITNTVTVAGTAGPWIYSSTLNSSFQYGVGDETAPTVISTSGGIDFTAGNTLTVTYISGLVGESAFSSTFDANGNPNFAFNNNPGIISGTSAPSKYMDPTTYPIYLVELVGTFADSNGAIVGTPFAIGDGPKSLTIPVGAHQLQLGVNDDIYSDNPGSWTINVTGPAVSAVPEPSTLAMAGTAALLLGLGYAWRRRKRAA